MNNSINLLNYKNKPPSIKDDKGQKRLRLIALIILFVVSSSSIVFFILVALSPIPGLRRQQKSASFRLSQVSEDILKLALTKDRAKGIEETIDNRSTYEIALENIQSKTPAGVTIKAISIYKNNLTISLSSKSLQTLDNFLNSIIEADNLGNEFSDIRLVSLAAEKSKDTFLLVLNLNII